MLTSAMITPRYIMIHTHGTSDQNRMNDAAMHKLGAFINPFSGCGQAAL